MLDDLQKKHERDNEDVLGVAAKQWQQLATEFAVTPGLTPMHVLNVVYAGMGGSALAASFVPTWPTVRVPFEVVREYTVPPYVGQQTLFIAGSYSGNTEETIEATRHAAELGAVVAVITQGGALADLARERGYLLVLLPEIRQPRFGALYAFKALITLLEQAGVCSVDRTELQAATEFVRAEVEAWLPTIPVKRNLAKQIAQECMGRSVVLYSGPKLAPSAYKWKVSINENAKQVAWWNTYPEFNHNEFIGWSKQPEQKPYAVIELYSDLEHPRIQKRFEVTERLLSGKRPAPIAVQVEGQTILAQLVWAAVLGDFVSLYLAFLNGLNPASLELVDKLKRALE